MSSTELRLYRTAPPAPDPGSDPPRYQVAPGIWIVADVPRWIDPVTISAESMLEAVNIAAQQVFGHGHRAAFDQIAGVRPGSLNQWARREQIPPPRLVAWLAWLAGHPDPASLGAALRLVEMCGDDAEARVRMARTALEEARR